MNWLIVSVAIFVPNIVSARYVISESLSIMLDEVFNPYSLY